MVCMKQKDWSLTSVLLKSCNLDILTISAFFASSFRSHFLIKRRCVWPQLGLRMNTNGKWCKKQKMVEQEKRKCRYPGAQNSYFWKGISHRAMPGGPPGQHNPEGNILRSINFADFFGPHSLYPKNPQIWKIRKISPKPWNLIESLSIGPKKVILASNN